MSNTFVNDAAGALAFCPESITVDVEGQIEPPIALIDSKSGCSADGATATFEWTGTSADFGEARQIVPRGQRIRASLRRASFAGHVDDHPIFDGYVVAVRVQFSGEERRILIDAVDGVRFHFEGRSLVGVHSRTGTTVIELPDEPLVFNPGGRPNRSLSRVSLGRSSQTCHVFDFTGQAAFWSAADIADYLIVSRLLDARIDWPSADRLDSLSGSVRPHSLDLTGASPLAALERLANLAGCSYAIEPITSARHGGRWRVVWFGTRGRRSVVLYHQQGGEPVTESTNVVGGTIAFDHDSARRLWVAYGEPERIESTFTLLRGWDQSLEGDSHRTYSRANPQFAAVRDAYRRWVLNEAGDYSLPPFSSGPAADLAGLFGGPCILRRRRFRPTLSCDSHGQSFGVLVEVSYDSGATWCRYPGRVEILADEAGVWFADEQLPTDFWRAATAGSLAVRATATIESDRRVQAELLDDSQPDACRTIRRIARFPGRFRRNCVAQTSVLSGGPADEVDDRESLAAALAYKAARESTPGVGGKLFLPWLTAVYQVGDCVSGIGGQGLAFSSGRTDPLVRSVRHQLGEQWQTTLELE